MQPSTIGMLVTTTSANPFAEVVRGVGSLLLRAGYSLILCNTENQPPRQQHYLRMLMEKRVDGLLVLGTDIDTSSGDMLRIHKNVPQVVLDWGNECDFANVINDNARIGARLAVRHLLEQGHTDIVCITGHLAKTDYPAAAGRGARDALAEQGLTLKDEQIFEGDYESQSGFDAMQRILALTRVRPRCSPSTTPWPSAPSVPPGSRGQVPDDISMIGYDDVEMARFSSPPLTTIRHPKAELGLLAVQQLVSRIRQQGAGSRVHDGAAGAYRAPLGQVPALIPRRPRPTP